MADGKVSIPKVNLTPTVRLTDNQRGLVVGLRALAEKIEKGTPVTSEKPLIREIVDKILIENGTPSMIRAMVVKSKYLAD